MEENCRLNNRSRMRREYHVRIYKGLRGQLPRPTRRNILVRSQAASERVFGSISNFIESTLKLKINREKSKVCPVNQSKFLGYTIQGDGRLTIAGQSKENLKAKIRKITQRNRGRSLIQIIKELNQMLRGWNVYFRHAKSSRFLQETDSWLRRKLRCYRLKQCKRVKTLQTFLHGLGVAKWQSWILALSGKGHWRKSGAPQSHQAMNLKWFEELGLYSLWRNHKLLNNY